MRIAVIGGGPAGLAAAGAAGEAAFPGGENAVTLYERNEKTGKKLYITGKGRCNVTNDCPPAEFLKNVVSNPKFLYGAIYSFTPADTVSLLGRFGLACKVERGGRVFPVTDKASDVTKALTAYAQKYGAVRLNERVLSVEKTDGRFTVKTERGNAVYDKVVVATGGSSYPSTGSDGDGYRFARAFGHAVVPPRASLVPILVREDVGQLEGLSLKNVRASVRLGKKTLSEFGELLFTADGLSGPIALTLSAYLAREEAVGALLTLDLKPALARETLDKRILSDFGKYANRQFRNALDDLLPRSLVPYVVNVCGVPPEKPVNVVTSAERAKLLLTLKALPFTIRGLDKIERAVVTAGGVSVKELNPKTMESKLVPGLYFAGEVIDADALTGGFNIQIALSTGIAAGRSAGGET